MRAYLHTQDYGSVTAETFFRRLCLGYFEWRRNNNEMSLTGNVKDDAEPRLAAHHPLVRFSGSFQRKNFVHGMHIRRRTEFKCILRVDGRSRVPAFDGSTASDEQNRINR